MDKVEIAQRWGDTPLSFAQYAAAQAAAGEPIPQSRARALSTLRVDSLALHYCAWAMLEAALRMAEFAEARRSRSAVIRTQRGSCTVIRVPVWSADRKDSDDGADLSCLMSLVPVVARGPLHVQRPSEPPRPPTAPNRQKRSARDKRKDEKKCP